MALPNSIRRKREEEGESWQLTLADMMTLLLCFFVIIVSISVVDVKRFDAVSESMEDAMGPKKKAPKAPVDEMQDLPQEFRSLVTGPVTEAKTLEEIFADLRSSFGADAEGVKLEMRDQKIMVQLDAQIFFEPGSAEMSVKAARYLKEVATALSGAPYHVTVEGHTDNIPIRTDRYPSNWELSSSRASAVVRFLIHNGLSRFGMKAVGLADAQPVLPNTDSQGTPIPANQKQNRRVVILISP
jgi:chemotaxis protein MotB